MESCLLAFELLELVFLKREKQNRGKEAHLSEKKTIPVVYFISNRQTGEVLASTLGKSL